MMNGTHFKIMHDTLFGMSSPFNATQMHEVAICLQKYESLKFPLTSSHGAGVGDTAENEGLNETKA